jgi:hypothetical protein
MIPVDFPQTMCVEHSFRQDDLQNYSIDLAPYLGIPTMQSLKQIGCQPVFVEIPQDTIKEIYSLSDACLLEHFEEVCHLAKCWEQEFSQSEESVPWENVRFGIRDKRPAKHRKKDQKFYLQFCREFGEWVMQNHPEELASIPKLELLFRRLLEVERVCQRVFVEKITEMAENYSGLEKLFYFYHSEYRVPISIRVISYEYEGDFSVSPHFDKAAMTILLPSDDAPESECLIVAPADGSAFDPDKLCRPLRPVPNTADTTCGLFITGSMLEYIGIPIPPTPHAVLPHNRKLRHVLVAFCNVPYLDTTHLNYAILYKKDLPSNFVERFENKIKIGDILLTGNKNPKIDENYYWDGFKGR